MVLSKTSVGLKGPDNVAFSRFLGTYRRHHNFAFPFDSIIYYITKNPSSTKAYKKLIQSCKYFFVQNPVLVVVNLSFQYHNNNGLNICFNNERIETFNKVLSKIWVGDILCVRTQTGYVGVQDHFSTNIIPKIYQCEVKHLTLEYQTISFCDFIFLASKCTYVSIDKVTVTDENGVVVPLERLFVSLPEIKEFSCWLTQAPSNIVTSKTAQELIEIPHFKNLQDFQLYGLPEVFDIDSFYAYIKTNKTTFIMFTFNESISKKYETHLQMIVNEIIEAKNCNFKAPFFSFPGITGSSEQKLVNLLKKA